MAGLIIKNLPYELHQKLKARAAQHRRSMTKEAIVLLERGLESEGEVREPPAPYKGECPLTEDFIDKAKREGRE